MGEKSKEIISTPEKEEIQKILQEVPDDVLIGVIADRIQRDPNK